VIVDAKSADKVRDKALRACADPDAARAAWEKIADDPRCHGKTSRAARLAMLQAIAAGKTVDDAAKAARAVLE